MKKLIIPMLLATSAYATPQDLVEPEFTSGRYYLYKAGEQLPGYKLRSHTALAEAVRLADECECTITVKMPDVKVKVRRTPRITTTPEGRAVISWTIPTTRENGDALDGSDIRLFEIKYMRGDESLMVAVAGDNDSYTFDRLEPGLWSFSMLTEDINGLRSGWSDVVQKQIN